MWLASRFPSIALGSLAAMAVAVPALAQSVAIQADVNANGQGQLRDSRTGTVWTPGVVDNRLSKDNRLEPPNQPPTSADAAFDPRSQIATAEPLTVQRPNATLIGAVPITAGPTVPLVTVDGASLQAIPGDRWLTVLYVNNNSAAAVDSQIGCTFTNGDKPVQEARIVIPTTAAGSRVGVPVYGPRTDVFVDRVLCRVLAP